MTYKINNKKPLRKRIELSHIDIEEMQFFIEMKTKPKSKLAEIMKVGVHPLNYYTKAKYIIIFYYQHTRYLSHNQIILLMYHELLHIPIDSKKPLNRHSIQDFYHLVNIDPLWNIPGRDVPNILE